MSDLKFFVKKEKETADYGKYVISPLPQGFGHTIGNSLRRVLLGYIEGAAITQIKVKGANNPFSVLKGVKEDLIDIIMNLKQIRIAYEGDKAVKLHLTKTGPGEVKATDIEKASGVKIINPGLTIANLADKKSKLEIDFTVERGVGYSLAEDHKSGKTGVIAVDAIFSPVTKVNYDVREIRVGKEENMNEVILEIWVDKTTTPAKVLKEAAEILVNCFNNVLHPPKIEEKVEAVAGEGGTKSSLYIEEIDLPLRLVNALKKAGFKKLEDFSGLKKADLFKVKNVGEKSCQQLIEVLKSKGVSIEE